MSVAARCRSCVRTRGSLLRLAARPLSRRQHTLRSNLRFSGVGLHSGVKSELHLKPAAPGTGILFGIDGTLTRAHYSNVSPSDLCTTLSDGAVSLATVEHLLAAFAAVGVDNCVIEVSGPEVPILDGSSILFVEKMLEVGFEHQPYPTPYIKVVRDVEVLDGNRSTRLLPLEQSVPTLQLAVEMDFSDFGLSKLRFDCDCCYDSLAMSKARDQGQPHLLHDVMSARTFTFLSQVEQLQQAGLIKGGSLDNAVVFDDTQGAPTPAVLNPEGLRFDDEWVRHKALDALGDLFLAGMPLHAKYHGVRSGHSLNVALLRELFSDERNFVIQHF